jgi:hypothetical protein
VGVEDGGGGEGQVSVSAAGPSFRFCAYARVRARPSRCALRDLARLLSRGERAKCVRALASAPPSLQGRDTDTFYTPPPVR